MQQQKELVWSLYWAENRLHSCVASGGEADQKVLNALWVALAESLPEQADVLDLATGNGAVPAAMLSVNSGLNIEAVDLADIDPTMFVKDRPEFENMKSEPTFLRRRHLFGTTKRRNAPCRKSA